MRLRAYPQGTVFDLHLDAVARFVDEFRREPGEAVIHVERDAGLGRGKGMCDGAPRG